ncbi:ankyrin-1-like [Trichogramma pretiosum]|uniref:ankyrin-1-like n=1 Tax=Trichogramma pretiosum TaxID=7493 RepID=UPI0006C94F56|nr:ankyrin-1-like [Trichogramma pretiosum]
MAENDQECLKKLKILRGSVNWEYKPERRKFLHELYPLIRKWKGQLPDLRDIFRTEDIDLLLSETIGSVQTNDDYYNNLVPLVKFVIKTGYKDEPGESSSSRHRTTPLHRAARRPANYKNYSLLRELFKIYDNFVVNHADEFNLTHLHVACMSDCVQVVERFIELGHDLDCIERRSGDSPLHVAVKNNQTEVAELLLTNGADPRIVNATGSNALQRMFAPQSYIDDSRATGLLRIADEKHHLVPIIDARDKEGDALLHLALSRGDERAVELLLTKGASPNLPNERGLTPLHIVYEKKHHDNLAELFFAIIDALGRTVLIDAVDERGKTPLHYALDCGHGHSRLLLRRGASPNLADDEGSTALHVISRLKKDDDSMKLFFEIVDEVGRATVQVDAVDKLGLTPLQLAVANLKPNQVGLLLDRGADLSNFVFPSESSIDARFKWRYVSKVEFLLDKLNLSSGFVACLEHLEKRGYELDRSDAWTLMKLFAKYGFVAKSATNRPEYWYDDEEFAIEAKKSMIRSGLSLYDLIRLQPRELVKRLTHTDEPNIRKWTNSWWLTKSNKARACIAHLCEKMLRRFFQRWTLDPFWKLIHYRLPILCCDMIIEELTNQDLYNICLVADRQNDEERKKNSTSMMECQSEGSVERAPKKFKK